MILNDAFDIADRMTQDMIASVHRTFLTGTYAGTQDAFDIADRMTQDMIASVHRTFLTGTYAGTQDAFDIADRMTQDMIASVRRTHVIHEPSIWPNSSRVSRNSVVRKYNGLRWAISLIPVVVPCS